MRILSRIGAPIDQPQVASAGVVLENGVSLSSVTGDIEGIIHDELANVRGITKIILSGLATLF